MPRLKALLALTAALCWARADAAAEWVRQCTCDELNGCKESVNSGLMPCVERCKAELDVDFDADTVLACIRVARQHNVECVMRVKSEMCTIKPYNAIKKNDTFHNNAASKRLQLHVFQPQLSASKLASAPKGSGFMSVLQNALGEQGPRFKDCMQSCVIQTDVFSCVKKLGCGVRRPPIQVVQEMFKQCGADSQSTRKRICECVRDAGVTNASCD